MEVQEAIMGKLSALICKKLNMLFPLPVHPFNLQKNGIMTYEEWQFDKGRDTIKFFLEHFTAEEMFKDKLALDIGCGAGGKTIYYASLGVKKIYGTDIITVYKDKAEDFAKKKTLHDRFEFVLVSGEHLPFNDNYFDTIIMNDSFEHIANPQKILEECHRVLKPGSRLFINFPPYFHPYGAHLSDLIGIPWAHVFFTEQTLISVYKDLARSLPDGSERISLRFSKNRDGTEYISYINKMTIRSFNRIRKSSKLKLIYYREVPLRNFLAPLSKFPPTKEFFVRMVVAVFEKD